MKKLSIILSWLVTLLMPILLILGSVRLLLNPWYLEFEYRTPGFPVEPYGFGLQDRLEYARLALEYLVNDEGIEFLADLRFPEGELVPEPSCSYMNDCTRMYNERELKHMLDVKVVLSAALDIWLMSLLLVVGLGIWAWRGGWLSAYRLGLSRGSQLTLILIAAILALVLVAFGVFFVAFHNVFFEEGTWLFFYSDTLIRLFPERFWRDTFLTVGGLSALMALIIWGITKKNKSA